MPAQGVLVIGLGYVGLPRAVQAARAGFRVTGDDTSAEITDGLMAGRSHVDDVTDAEVAAMLGQGFLVTSDEAGIGPQDVIVICVPTARSGPRRRPRAGCCGWARWCRSSPPPIPAPPRKWSARC